MDRVRHVWLLPALVVVLCGCGGSKSSPAGPAPIPQPPPGPAVPAAPSGVRLVGLDTAARSAIIQWDAVEGADRYVVEYWNVFETSVTITSTPTNGAETTATLRDLPGDFLSVRVRAGNAGGMGEPSMPPVQLQIPVQKDIVEALFFGTGPYGTGFFARPSASDCFQVAAQGAHASAGTMLGWSGGRIRVRVEEAVNEAQFSTLNRVVMQIADLTGGYLRPEIVQRAGRLPDVFEVGEIRVMAREDLSVVCRTSGAILGCAPQLFLTGGQLVAALIYMKPNGNPDTMAHEAGHAVLGLHHVTRVQMPVRPVMSTSAGPSADGFSTLEADAIRAVYSAGLRFGASREEFLARGLIR